MKLYYNINEPVIDSETGFLIEKCDRSKGYIQQQPSGELMFYNYTKEESEEIRVGLLRQWREDIYTAFNTYVAMLNAGVIQITEQRKKEIFEWYQKVKDVTEPNSDESVLERANIPEEVLYYYKPDEEFLNGI